MYVVGIGPGGIGDMTHDVAAALRDSDVIVGYKLYLQLVRPLVRKETELLGTGMRQERERAELALDLAVRGKKVCVVSSGDACIYGMAPLMFEVARERNLSVDIVVLPGVSAFQKAAALLGAPTGHDFCAISLSDLMTPWHLIERRIKAAAIGDFVTAVYNPKSTGRYWQLYRLKELMLQHRSEETVVGYVRQAGREGETVVVTTLGAFDPEDIDMFTIVVIGNSESFVYDGKFVTPRGYHRSQVDTATVAPGQAIMMQSFATIRSELRQPEVPLWRLWPLLHAIHTTADFSMECILWMDSEATELLYKRVESGQITTIVTDVSMVKSGIRQGALERLGIEVVCYIGDERCKSLAKDAGITRAQAAMRLAAAEHPDALYAIGNAPTALLELCELVRRGKAAPQGVVAAPVGFVHVEESKHAVKTLVGIPKIVVEGRKGGSNLAATLVNSILTYDDAVKMMPGRDV